MEILRVHFFIYMCVATIICDMWLRKVPNWLVLLGVFGQLGCLFFSLPLDPQFANSWSSAGLGAAFTFLFFLPLYVFRAMGAGDVKFFAVLGFWLGLGPTLIVCAIGTLLAGLHALWVVLVPQIGLYRMTHRCGELNNVLMQFRWGRRLSDYATAKRGGTEGVPYAAYLAIGAITYVFWAP